MLLGPHVLVPHRSGRDMQVNLLFCPEITAIISTEFIHSSLAEQVQCSESVLRPGVEGRASCSKPWSSGVSARVSVVHQFRCSNKLKIN